MLFFFYIYIVNCFVIKKKRKELYLAISVFLNSSTRLNVFVYTRAATILR